MTAKIHCPQCGCEFDEELKGKPRSLDQHRRYFGVMRAAFHHWPETHDRQFGDAEELRAWVQMKAGYREIAAQIPLVGINREKAMLIVEAAVRAAGSYAVPVIHGDTLVIFKPKSIAFRSLPHPAFCDLNNAVDEVIKTEIGIDADTLLKETERAA